ncbi:hypothetical protein [Haloferax larsenii]|uniref:Ribbon-helix-helix protein, copG family n=1 Tax=Haloferax larsenii TaxID=302484 RepID=A0A1H7QS26_HALLR|nr:hypothetical protein [Haloferax larsenii]SEL50544.1 hypothetical protein SAMN04488691_105130 [Haloferax larsenii]
MTNKTVSFSASEEIRQKIKQIERQEDCNTSEALRKCVRAFNATPSSELDERISELKKEVDGLQNEKESVNNEIDHKKAEIERLQAKREKNSIDEERYQKIIESCAEVKNRGPQYDYTNLDSYPEAVEMKNRTQVEKDIEQKADELNDENFDFEI